jgi:hypothetical protein
MSNTHSVVIDLLVRPCKAFSHAVLASLRGLRLKCRFFLLKKSRNFEFYFFMGVP